MNRDHYGLWSGLPCLKSGQPDPFVINPVIMDLTTILIVAAFTLIAIGVFFLGPAAHRPWVVGFTLVFIFIALVFCEHHEYIYKVLTDEGVLLLP